MFLNTVIVGRQHHNHTPDNLNRLALRRHSANIHDENAVMVIDENISSDNTLGYLPRRIAAFIAPLMDHHCFSEQPQFSASSSSSNTSNMMEGVLCLKFVANLDSGNPKITKALQDLQKEKSNQDAPNSRTSTSSSSSSSSSSAAATTTVAQPEISNARGKSFVFDPEEHVFPISPAQFTHCLTQINLIYLNHNKYLDLHNAVYRYDTKSDYTGYQSAEDKKCKLRDVILFGRGRLLG